MVACLLACTKSMIIILSIPNKRIIKPWSDDTCNCSACTFIHYHILYSLKWSYVSVKIEGHIILQNLVVWISKNLVACQFGINIFHGPVTFSRPVVPINNEHSLTTASSVNLTMLCWLHVTKFQTKHSAHTTYSTYNVSMCNALTCTLTLCM